MIDENEGEVDAACQVCGELGEDKRRLFVDCGWDMSKMLSPFKLVQGEFPTRGYDMYFCKDCRTKFLAAIDRWFTSQYKEPEKEHEPPYSTDRICDAAEAIYSQSKYYHQLGHCKGCGKTGMTLFVKHGDWYCERCIPNRGLPDDDS